MTEPHGGVYHHSLTPHKSVAKMDGKKNVI